MFARLATVSLLALAAVAKPVDVSARTFGQSISFNGWHGISSLSGFDNFYGVDNFSGVVNEQVFAQQDVLVCHTVDVTIIQQQIAVLVENMKRVLTEQVCQVETQTVLLSQVQAHFSSFSEDIRHVSSRHVGFDRVVAGHIGSLFDESGAFTASDLGFSGHDIGAHSSFVVGNNWNPATSPAIVNQAFSDARTASGFQF